jgi:hypothetical protein
VRDDEDVFVWFAGYSDRATFDASRQARDEIGRAAAGSPRLTNAPLTLQLAPTRRSLLTGATSTSTGPSTSTSTGRDDG